MKKTAIIVLSVIMVICLAIVGAFAADRDRKREHVEECTKTCETQNCTVDCNNSCDSKNYADENSDGVCAGCGLRRLCCGRQRKLPTDTAALQRSQNVRCGLGRYYVHHPGDGQSEDHRSQGRLLRTNMVEWLCKKY